MGWLEGVWDGNSMLKFQHTYADFPAGKIPNADISAHMLESQHDEYYKLENCRYYLPGNRPALPPSHCERGTTAHEVGEQAI